MDIFPKSYLSFTIFLKICLLILHILVCVFEFMDTVYIKLELQTVVSYPVGAGPPKEQPVLSAAEPTIQHHC